MQEVIAVSLVVSPEPVPLDTDADGVIRVGGTRVTLATVVHAFRSGATPEEIATQFPSLPLGDVYAVLTYYLRHRTEVDDHLARLRVAADDARRANEELHSPVGIRERLIARHLA